MTKIAVFSDMHIPSRLDTFPHKKILPYLQDIDYIFGLGDYDSQEGLDALLGLGKKTFCIKGNMDPFLLSLSIKLIINIENVRIGLIHGWGAPLGLRKKINKEFNKVDMICYGHTHSQFWGEENEIFYFNPGALCNKQPSFGILSIENKDINVEFINI